MSSFRCKPRNFCIKRAGYGFARGIAFNRRQSKTFIQELTLPYHKVVAACKTCCINERSISQLSQCHCRLLVHLRVTHHIIAQLVGQSRSPFYQHAEVGTVLDTLDVQSCRLVVLCLVDKLVERGWLLKQAKGCLTPNE